MRNNNGLPKEPCNQNKYVKLLSGRKLREVGLVCSVSSEKHAEGRTEALQQTAWKITKSGKKKKRDKKKPPPGKQLT